MNIDNNFSKILNSYNPKDRKSHSILRFFSEDLLEDEKHDFVTSIYERGSWILPTEISMFGSDELRKYAQVKFDNIFDSWVDDRISYSLLIEGNKRFPFIPYVIVLEFREALISTKNLGFPIEVMTIFERFFLECHTNYIRKILEDSCWLIIDEFNVLQIEEFFSYFLELYIRKKQKKFTDFFYVFLSNLANSPEIFNLSSAFISRLKDLSKELKDGDYKSEYSVLISILLIHYIENKNLNLATGEFNNEVSQVINQLERGAYNNLGLFKFLKRFNYSFKGLNFHEEISTLFEKFKTNISVLNNADDIQKKSILAHYLKSSDQYFELFLFYIENVESENAKDYLIKFVSLIDDLRRCFETILWFKEFLNFEAIPGEIETEIPYGFNVKIDDTYFSEKLKRYNFPSVVESDFYQKHSYGFLKSELVKEYHRFSRTQNLDESQPETITKEYDIEEFFISNINYSPTNKWSVLSLVPFSTHLKSKIQNFNLKAFFPSLELFLVEKLYEMLGRDSPFRKRGNTLNKIFGYQNNDVYNIRLSKSDFGELLKIVRYGLYYNVYLKYKRQEEAFKVLCLAYEEDSIISGKIVARRDGGMVVDINGFEAFLPGSQIDVKAVKDYDQYVNTILDFKIVKVTHTNNNIVVSHKVLIEAENNDKRLEFISSLRRYQVLEGTVKNITNYGAFIDLGCVDGLVHITDLSWSKVNHPSDIVDIEQVVKVQVLEFDMDGTRIQLGLKQIDKEYLEYKAKIKEGDVIEGDVVAVNHFGVFIKVIEGMNVFAHKSELLWSRIPLLFDEVKVFQKLYPVGEKTKVMITSINHDEGKIAGSIKKLTSNPPNKIEFKYNNILGGKPIFLNHYGAIILLENNLLGFLDISQISWSPLYKEEEDKLHFINNFFAEKEKMNFLFLSYNRYTRLVALSIKYLNEKEWLFFAKKVLNKIIYGNIKSTNKHGMVVELDNGLEGFIHISKLDSATIHQSDKLQLRRNSISVGDRVRVKVISINVKRFSVALNLHI